MPQEFIKTLYFCKAKRLFRSVSTQSMRVNRGNASHLCPTFVRVGRRHKARQHIQPLPTACKEIPKEPIRARGMAFPHHHAKRVPLNTVNYSDARAQEPKSHCAPPLAMLPIGRTPLPPAWGVRAFHDFADGHHLQHRGRAAHEAPRILCRSVRNGLVCPVWYPLSAPQKHCLSR